MRLFNDSSGQRPARPRRLRRALVTLTAVVGSLTAMLSQSSAALACNPSLCSPPPCMSSSESDGCGAWNDGGWFSGSYAGWVVGDFTYSGQTADGQNWFWDKNTSNADTLGMMQQVGYAYCGDVGDYVSCRYNL